MWGGGGGRGRGCTGGQERRTGSDGEGDYGDRGPWLGIRNKGAKGGDEANE